MTTQRDLLHDELVEVINRFHPEWESNKNIGFTLSDLEDTIIEDLEEIKNQTDPKEEALKEITEENCRGLNPFSRQ